MVLYGTVFLGQSCVQSHSEKHTCSAKKRAIMTLQLRLLYLYSSPMFASSCLYNLVFVTVLCSSQKRFNPLLFLFFKCLFNHIGLIRMCTYSFSQCMLSGLAIY